MDGCYCLKLEGAKEREEAVCTHFQWANNEKKLKKGEFTIKEGMFIVNYDDGIGGLDNFKKWLNEENEKGTPVEVFYELNTPKITEIKGDDIYISTFKSRAYDIESISKANNINAFILFICDFPYQLQFPNDVYKIETDIDLSENIKSNSNKKRKIIYCISKECVYNQKISPKSGNFKYNPKTKEYSFFTSNMEIIIEIKEDDILKQPFHENEKEIIRILQSSLEIIAAKYNEALAGKDFWNPLAQETGAQRVAYLVKNNINDVYGLKDVLISPGIYVNSVEELEREKIQEIINKPYKIWKYFFNRAKYSFENYNNLECIIYSAICIEAYINNLLETKCLVKEFKCYQQSKERRNYSFFHLVEFLFYKKVFTEEEKDFVCSVFGGINIIRNDIVHGKITTPILSRKNAQIAKEGAISIIRRFEK